MDEWRCGLCKKVHHFREDAWFCKHEETEFAGIEDIGFPEVVSFSKL